MEIRTTIALWVIIIAAACSNASDRSSGKISGKTVYDQYCKLCHGADGRLGLNNAANLALSTLSRDSIAAILTHGRNTMQSYEGILSEAQRNAVTDYIISLRQP